MEQFPVYYCSNCDFVTDELKNDGSLDCFNCDGGKFEPTQAHLCSDCAEYVLPREAEEHNCKGFQKERRTEVGNSAEKLWTAIEEAAVALKLTGARFREAKAIPSYAELLEKIGEELYAAWAEFLGYDPEEETKQLQDAIDDRKAPRSRPRRKEKTDVS